MRASRRFAMRLPVELQSAGGVAITEKTHTRDISSRGICFYTDARIEPGSEVEFTLTLPPEITMTEAIQVHCKGKVLRVEEIPGGRLAIAAQINQYQFIPAQ